MSLGRDDRWVADAQGRALAGALVFWCLEPATVGTTPPPSPLANLFTDLTGDTPLAQPVITDGFGHAYAYMDATVLYTVVVFHPLFGTNPVILLDQAIASAQTSPLAILSFTGAAASLELGQSETNPTIAATYSGTPTGANVTNTDSIDSPLTLVSPFTSGTIVGTFVHAATHTTTVTLTAIGSSTQTANQQITWNPRIFGGSGAAGATSSVTASGNTAVLSNSSVLASAGLGAETVGQTFGPFTVSGSNIYLLLTGASHTFIDANTGFPFAFNAPLTVTFVNQFGVTITMYLYQSTHALFGSYAPKVVS